MKAGVFASVALHAAALTWGLWSLAPAPLEVANVESLPVELVPMEEFSQAVIGDKDAPVTETPAPTPTEKPQTLPMPAENVGDNETDFATPPTPVERPRPVEQAAAAKAAETPAPEPEPEPEPTPPVAETPPPTETPPPEPTPVEAAPEPTPDPVEQAIEQAQAEPDVEPVPQNVPLPADRPRPPAPPKVAEAKPEPEKPRPAKETKTAEKATPEESDFDADQIAALLNREKSAGGGAKRSTQTASLGGERTTGAKLSMSELDALRGQIQKCWSPPSGVSEAGSLRISIQMRLDPAGQLEGRPTIVDGGGGSMIARVAGEAALRAVQRCQPYNLPADKYDTWSDVTVNFDPSQMF